LILAASRDPKSCDTVEDFAIIMRAIYYVI
jgi:hypothetical protein